MLTISWQLIGIFCYVLWSAIKAGSTLYFKLYLQDKLTQELFSKYAYKDNNINVFVLLLLLLFI